MTQLDRLPDGYDGDTLDFIIDNLESKLWNIAHLKEHKTTSIEDAAKIGSNNARLINEAVEYTKQELTTLIATITEEAVVRELEKVCYRHSPVEAYDYAMKQIAILTNINNGKD